MCQFVLSLLLSLFIILTAEPSAHAQYSRSYNYYLQEGQDALNRRDLKSAIKYFKHAHLIEPSAQYPVRKIRSIENSLNHNGDDDAMDAQTQTRIYRRYLAIGKQAFNGAQYPKALYYFQLASRADPEGQEAAQYINLIKRMSDARISDVKNKTSLAKPQAVMNALDAVENDLYREQEPVTIKTRKAQPSKILPAQITSSLLRDQPKPKNFETIKTLALDDPLWSTQPKTDLRIELKSYLILESRDIERFLIITPGTIVVERVDRDHLKITAGRIGTTYLHVWDNRGRWTFNVQVVFPVQVTTSQPQKSTEEQYADPFKFSYTIDGSTLYRGPSIPEAERKNLNMQQTLGVIGDTPYGKADASVGYTKFDESTEATSYTVGLSDAKMGTFTDVNIRGYDASKYFSALTFPGQYFRGILAEGKAVGEKIGAVYLHGQDRYTYSFISPGSVQVQRSYVEGARVTLFPNQENQYSFNYARGYGPARQTFLNNEVYSLEARQRFQKMLMQGEVATNHDTLAKTLTSKLGGDHRRFRASFRDIDKDFTTITNLPSNQGEIGGTLGMDLDYERFSVSSDADLYRDRLFPNAENPDALNYDLDSSVRVPINNTTGWTSTVYYLNTPGELSARRNFRLINTLSKKYKILGRDLNTFVGGNYQRSRNDQTPISEYDRYSVNSGFQIGLIRGLSYFANYEYSWVNELLTDRFLYPSVFNTGLNYSKQLTQKVSGTVGFYYRDEQNTEGTNSFLAGEDSITGSLGVSYRPTNSSEVFMDSRFRNVWKEQADNPAYNEIDVRWGLRSSWELPLTWNPSGILHGYAFNDLNANGRKDANETGIANVRIKVGKQETSTDNNGRYSVKVSAKKVLISPDLSTVPSGYVLTTPGILEIRIPNGTSVDFGFNTESGIYGVVFYDRNNNGQPDEGDEFIPKTKIILDGKATELSGYDGTYFFKNVSDGKHSLRIDVNSIPLEYLPTVKLVTALEITEGTTYVFHVPLKRK